MFRCTKDQGALGSGENGDSKALFVFPVGIFQFHFIILQDGDINYFMHGITLLMKFANNNKGSQELQFMKWNFIFNDIH